MPERGGETQKPLKVRHPSGYGKAGRTAKKISAKLKKKLLALGAVILVAAAIGTVLMAWAFSLPREEETTTPEQFRISASLAPKESSGQ